MSGPRNGTARPDVVQDLVTSLVEFMRRRRDAADAAPTPPCKCATPEVIESTRERITHELEDAFDSARIRRVNVARELQEFEADGVSAVAELEGTLKSAEAALWHWNQRQHGTSARELNDEALGRQNGLEAVHRAKKTLEFCLEMRQAARSEKLRELGEARNRVARVARCMSAMAQLDCHGQMLAFERQFLPWNDGNPSRPVTGYETRAGHDTHVDGSNGGTR